MVGQSVSCRPVTCIRVHVKQDMSILISYTGRSLVPSSVEITEAELEKYATVLCIIKYMVDTTPSQPKCPSYASSGGKVTTYSRGLKVVTAQMCNLRLPVCLYAIGKAVSPRALQVLTTIR